MSAAIAVRRIIAAVIFVALVSTCALILARRAPGDYTDVLRAARVPEESIARERSRLSLDRSLPRLSAIWLAGLARLDLGTSYRFGRPVRELIAERAPRTLGLVAGAIFLSFVIGIVWGTSIAGGSRPLRAVLSAFATLALSLPSLAVLFALMFVALRAGWLGPISHGFVTPMLGMSALLLPAGGALARLHAEAMEQALAEPWAVASAARGVSRRTLVWKLAMRVAATRVTSVMPLVAANVFGASLLVEIVTGWAGLGRLMHDALVSRDVFLVAGCTAAIAAALAALSLLSDFIAAALDPRIETSAATEPAR